LILYFSILGVLAVYGLYRVKQVIEFWRYREIVPEPKSRFSEAELPHVTIQLPLFNEMYVVERLVKAITEIDYPQDRLEIQVLDDSTDETVKICAETVAKRSGGGQQEQHDKQDAEQSCATSARRRWCTSRNPVASSPARGERGPHQTMGGHDAAKIHPPTYCIRWHVARRHIPRQRGRGHPATAAQSGAAELADESPHL
jgi:cellulose synthase/poly-beta-1,6-N-acetylglucosamine synthase-like glycosyltransferase